MQAPSGAPFPAPPGLDPKADVEAKAAAAQAAAANLEEKLTQLGLGAPETSQFIEEIKAVIDNHVAGRADELRAWGTQMMGQMNKKMKEKTASLSEEVALCREKQARLETENEQLKEVLQHLAGRFQMLGALISSKVMADPLVSAAASMAAESAAGAAAVSVPSPGPQAGVAAAVSPQEGADAARAAPTAAAGPDQAAGTAAVPDAAPRRDPKMADIPPFPFPGPAAGTVPLSLAEALSSQVPQQQRTQLSLATSLSPAAAPAEAAAATPGQFTFTLRKADGADLGLDVSHSLTDKTLRIEGVRPEGAVEAWNRQCHGSVAAEKVVQVGDKLVSVNSVSYDPEKMLQECKDKQLLKLTIIRGERVPKTMRAEASVFVPQGAEPPRSPERAVEKGEGDAESTVASSLQATPVGAKPDAVSERV